MSNTSTSIVLSTYSVTLSSSLVSADNIFQFQQTIFNYMIWSKICTQWINWSHKVIGDSWNKNFLTESVACFITLTLSQCTLAGPVYTRMPLVNPVYTGILLGDTADACRVHWNTTGKKYLKLAHAGLPLEKLETFSPTLEHHWNKPLVETVPHWDATGELTFAAYTGTPLKGL